MSGSSGALLTYNTYISHHTLILTHTHLEDLPQHPPPCLRPGRAGDFKSFRTYLPSFALISIIL